MSWAVPLADVKVTEDDVRAYLDCLNSGWLTMGPRTKAFEEAFAEAVEAPVAVAVSSGTAGLHLSLAAAGVGPGDEVVVPAFSFVADAAAARYVGAEPVLADAVGDHDLNVDPADVAARITSRTKAVLAVHFMGYAADAVALRALCDERGIALVEDAAQAVCARYADGRQVGSAGEATAFSLFSKGQLCVGEGGMVVSPVAEIADTVRSLRSHAMTSVTWDRHRGHAESYDIVDVGFNFRMDEPRAALGLSRLERLAEDIERRRAVVRAYRSALAGMDGVGLPWTDADVERASHFAFPIMLETREVRDHVRERLIADGVQTTWYPSITSFTEYRDAAGTCPRAEAIADRHVALPLSSSYGDEQVGLVVEALRRAL